jgi:drug/metabolite transporter (DMT)-like permease
MCVTLWGSNFVFASILVQEFSPILLSAIRLSLTSAVLVFVAMMNKKLIPLTWRDLKWLIPLAIIGKLVNQTTFFSGLQTTDATTAALILSLTPITTSVFAAVFLREGFTGRMITGSIIAVIGVFFVVNKGNSVAFSVGVLFMFMAMLSFSISMIIIRKLSQRMDPMTITVYAAVIGSILLVPSALYMETDSYMSPHIWAWALLLGTGIVMQGVCAIIWNRQIQHVGPGKASMFLNFQPFVAMIVGFLLLGTTVGAAQLVGSFLIICGVILATTQRKSKPAPVLEKEA